MEKHILTMVDHRLKLFICLLVLTSTQVLSTPIHPSSHVNITYLDSAVAKGAVCLDGSPPAYWYSKGYGEGANNWLIYLQGGGWCGTSKDCGYRLRDQTGSSKYKATTIYLGQLRSVNQTENPDFYNWNRVYVAYCDSSSYMGDVEAADPIKNITRRGKRIFDAIMEDLLTKGMANAENVLLSGGSAGGLAAILHCDSFREQIVPNATRVKCFSDSGIFIHAKHLPGAEFRENFFAQVVEYHGITKSLPSSCTSRINASLCIFPEYIVKDIKTPLFLLESAFDHYQLQDHHFSNESTWKNCTDNIDICTPSQLQTMKDYGFALRKTMQQIRECSSIGMFVHSCYRHGHMYEKSGWDASTKLGDKTIAQAVGDWYFDRDSKPFQEIDTNEMPRRHDCTKLTAPAPSLHESTN